MRAVAYCRVSTKKEEQLDSLESQQSFFYGYAKNSGYVLIKVYADEGKSGTKIKNRYQLLKLLEDAKDNLFDIVLIKDVSRLARNTVDFLTSIRQLKLLGIQVVFVNFDQTSSQSSEFMLTMLSAIAQEESANTSKRVKFGKKQNAMDGRVPNLVYGYDKIPGEYFELKINETESSVVKRIFSMYVIDGFGTNRIALTLNNEGITTKRSCKWTQNGVKRILTNPIYIGSIINGKEEVKDFLTGERKTRPKEEWYVTTRANLKIIEEGQFYLAKNLLEMRGNNYKTTKEKEIDTYLFSKLIYCKKCNASYRRIVRTYKNTYVRWVCQKRNSDGIDACCNSYSVLEDELFWSIKEYFYSIIYNNMGEVTLETIKRFNFHSNKEGNEEKQYQSQLKNLYRKRERYIELYANEYITLDDLREKMVNLQEDINFLEKALSHDNRKDEMKKSYINLDQVTINDLLTPVYINNHFLKRVIQTIRVDVNGNIEVYLRNIQF